MLNGAAVVTYYVPITTMTEDMGTPMDVLISKERNRNEHSRSNNNLCWYYKRHGNVYRLILLCK